MSIEDKIKNAKNTYWLTDGISKEEVDDIIEKARNKTSKKHKDIISEMTNIYIEDNFIEVKKLIFGEHAEFSIDRSK